MDRLAEQVVAWHNRHPLAKRISIYDVHTIGVVALPFMRSGRAAAPAGPIEPVMTEESTTAPAALAAPLPHVAAPRWWQVLTPLLQRLGLARDADAQAWPLFSERFINRLSARQIARFALRHGHGHPPGEPDWPQRDVAIDEDLMARGAAQAFGAWPYEIYLMSAGIDAGPSRTRVLLARGAGGRMEVLGRRCLNPVPLLLLGGLMLAGVGLGAWALFKGDTTAQPALAAVAPAASAASAAASGPLAVASIALPPRPASEPTVSASAPAASAMATAASAPEPIEPVAASAPVPDIRPRLVLPPNKPRTAAASAVEQPAPQPTTPAPATALAEELNRPSKPAPAARPTDKADALTLQTPAAGTSGKQVALVGPASSSKAEAEAVLERMRGMLGQTVSDPSGLQAQVFQTHEGWRAAIWPFGSREQAQLINATLIARGMKTRAVDF